MNTDRQPVFPPVETIAELGRGHGKMDRRCSAGACSVYLVVSQSRLALRGSVAMYSLIRIAKLVPCPTGAHARP